MGALDHCINLVKSMDKVEAKRNIEKYETEITKWQALSRGLMSRDEMNQTDKEVF